MHSENASFQHCKKNKTLSYKICYVIKYMLYVIQCHVLRLSEYKQVLIVKSLNCETERY